MITKQCGVDWLNESGALTLPPLAVCDDVKEGTHTKTHSSGWTITGEVREDYFHWVNDFEASHPVHGAVQGNYETEVRATSEEAFADFYSNHPPKAWDYGDI